MAMDIANTSELVNEVYETSNAVSVQLTLQEIIEKLERLNSWEVERLFVSIQIEVQRPSNTDIGDEYGD